MPGFNNVCATPSSRAVGLCFALVTALFVAAGRTHAEPQGLYYSGKFYSQGYMEAQMANDKSATTFTRNVLSKAVKSTAAYYVEEDLNTWVAAKNLDTETLAPKDGASENKLTEKNVLSTSYVNADKNDPLKKVYTDQIKAITSSADGKTVTIYLLKTMGTLKATDFTLEDESGKTGPKVSKVAADSKDKKKLTWILALASAMVDSKSYALLYMKTDTGMSVRYTAPPKLSTTTALAVPPLQTTPAPTTTRTPTSSLTTTKSKTTLTTTVIKTSTKITSSTTKPTQTSTPLASTSLSATTTKPKTSTTSTAKVSTTASQTLSTTSKTATATATATATTTAAPVISYDCLCIGGAEPNTYHNNYCCTPWAGYQFPTLAEAIRAASNSSCGPPFECNAITQEASGKFTLRSDSTQSPSATETSWSFTGSTGCSCG